MIELKPTFENVAETNSLDNVSPKARTTDRAGHTALSLSGHTEGDGL